MVGAWTGRQWRQRRHGYVHTQQLTPYGVRWARRRGDARRRAFIVSTLSRFTRSVTRATILIHITTLVRPKTGRLWRGQRLQFVQQERHVAEVQGDVLGFQGVLVEILVEPFGNPELAIEIAVA